MSRPTFLLWHWDKLGHHVLEPLRRTIAMTNPDAFIEMLRHSQSLLPGLDAALLSDDTKAYEYLAHLDPKGLGLSEAQCIELLESWDQALHAISPPQSAPFRQLVREFLVHYSIRYIFTGGTFGYEPSLLLAEAVGKLKKSCSTNAAAKSSFEQFEKRFAKIMTDPTDPEGTLGAVSNLLEHWCKQCAGRGRTLSRSAQFLGTTLPHNDAKESMSRLYGFFSDYPNLRHAGTPSSSLRPLNEQDALIYSGISLMFAYCLSKDPGRLFD